MRRHLAIDRNRAHPQLLTGVLIETVQAALLAVVILGAGHKDFARGNDGATVRGTAQGGDQLRRAVHHHAYVGRPYDDICDDLETHGTERIGQATVDAAGFAADLAGYLEKQLGFFDRDERVHVELGAMERDDHGMVVALEWQADDTKRLLPNVEATLHVTPLISNGSGATSEITLRGRYSPPKTRHRGLIEHALARRLVDATLHTFLRHLADALREPAPDS